MKQTVLITGSSRGIGRAVAQRFSRENFNIVLNCNKSEKEMKLLEEDIKLLTPDVLSIRADVSDYGQVEDMFLEINRHFGMVDVLVNNAGISHIGLFNTMTPIEWKRVLDMNLSSVYNCSHVAIQGMINKKSGCIINISSIWGSVGASCEVVYSSSKAAVNGFTKALAKELGPCNIRVNAIACGLVETSMNACFSEDEKKALKEQISLGHFGTPEQISDIVYYLASDSSYFITGQVITADGGMI